MQRLGAVFIAICMVAISASVGAMLHFKFGLTITEASPISFGIILTLLLVHYQISRVRDHMLLDEQMDDLTRLKLALTKELQDVRELSQQLEASAAERLEKEVEPILAELDVIGTLVKQLAESCADLDDRVGKNEVQVSEINAKLMAATGSFKDLEQHLLANARNMALRNEKSLAEAQAAATREREREARHALPEPEPEAGPEYLDADIDVDAADFSAAADRLAKAERAFSDEEETAVRRALALGHIELFMQPIVTLPMRKPQFYEALTRLKADDGSLLTPDIILPVCRKNRFLPMLDRLAMNEAFRLLRRLADRGHPVDLFCNLSLESLADSDFFALMRDLFDQNRDLAPHVILEFSQADMRKFGMLEEETLKLLAAMGFRFSIDRITNLSAGFDEFAQRGVKFAKIAAPVLTHKDAGRGMDIHPADFSRLLSRKGIDLIVTHVESERDLVDLIDYNVHLAQGNHFAPAKPLKSASARPSEQSGTIPQQQQAAPQRSRRPANRPQSAPSKRPEPPSRPAAQPAPISRTAPSVSVPSSDVGRGSGLSSPVLQEGQGQSDSSEASRTLGENPKIAQALRAMAAQDGNNSEARDQFRAVLAEAAGLLDPVSASGPASAPVRQAQSRISAGAVQQRVESAQRGAAMNDRLPAADDFGLQTGTERGQFIEV